jgi:hypothetical protein
MHSRRVASVAALLLVVPVAACGEDEPTTTPRPLVSVPATTATATATATATGDAAPSAPDEAADEAQAAYLSWLAALEAQDAATACTIQHPELTIALRQEAILLDRAELGDPCTGFEALLWEDPLRETDPVAVETTTLTGEKAVLAVDFAASAVTVELELQRAAWRVLSEQRRTTATGQTTRWLRAWCDLELGATPAEVVARMGEPSGEYTVADGGEPQLWWAADQYDFRAYLDPVSGTVTDLVGDYDALSAADRALLECPELR